MPNRNPLENSTWRSLVADRPYGTDLDRAASPYSPIGNTRDERLEYQAQRLLQERVLARTDQSDSPYSPFQNGQVELFHRWMHYRHDLMEHLARYSEGALVANEPGEESP